MWQGLWAARASAAHPCRPSQGRQLGLVRSRPASAGAWLASTRWCCACCGVSRSRPSPGRSACRSGNWSVGRRGPSPGSRPGCASAPRIPLSASWPRPIGGSVSSPWRSSCSAPASSAPALWPAGGRADGRRELPGDQRGLRRAAGLRALSQSFGVYPALSIQAAWVPPNRRRPMILSAIAEKLKRQSKDDFKGRHYEATLILQAVSWYLRYPLSYRDIEELFLERGLEVDHSTLNRWVLAYAPLIEKRLRA